MCKCLTRGVARVVRQLRECLCAASVCAPHARPPLPARRGRACGSVGKRPVAGVAVWSSPSRRPMTTDRGSLACARALFVWWRSVCGAAFR